jgi:uncharacterized protein GlcG (DUF336 family)
MTLNLAEANSTVGAAIAKARQPNVNVSVAACDRQGHLIAVNRMDGAYATINRVFIGKAVVSAGTELPSRNVVGVVDDPPLRRLRLLAFSPRSAIELSDGLSLMQISIPELRMTEAELRR